MKQRLFILAALLVALAVPNVALAYNFSYTYQGTTLYYTITNSWQHQVRVDNPSNGNYYGYVNGDVVIPDSVEYNSTKYAVTSIGIFAFRDCPDITSVTIGGSVSNIGQGAFIECRGMTTVTIPNSVTSIGTNAFYKCVGLTTVTMPNSVTSMGQAVFEYCTGLTSVTISTSLTSIGLAAFEGCSSLTEVTIPNSVMSIGAAAFSGCSGLSSVTIPNSVTSISLRAFSGCNGLTSIVVEEGNTQYDSRENCNAIIRTNSNLLVQGCKTTVIPSSVTGIGEYAFEYCSGLTSIIIPNSVISIGNYAFKGCFGLTSVTIGSSVTSIGASAFSGCSGLTSLTIPNSVTNIGIEAFRYCTGLTSLTIPNSVSSIGNKAFEHCSSLTSVTIPNSVTSIGEWAFYAVRHIEYYGNATGAPWGAYSMNGVIDGDFIFSNSNKDTLVSYIGTGGNVTIPNSVTSIGHSAFYGCSGLTSVTIPVSVTSIGHSAFYGCSGLTSVTIPVSVTSIGDEAFSGCSGLTSVTIPESVTSIDYHAFYGCSGLTSVTIPESVSSIAEGAFSNCSGLTSVFFNVDSCVITCDFDSPFNSPITSFTFGENVRYIPAFICAGLTNLASVTIPSSVTSIGEFSFSYCSGLTSVYCETETPPTLDSYCFDGISPQFYVPCGSVSAYQNAQGWSDYSSHIQAVPFEITYAFLSSDDSMGTVDVGEVDCDSNVTVTATASSNRYMFAGWSDGINNATRTIHLTGDTSITAFFVDAYYSIFGHPDELMHGNVTGSRQVSYNDSTTLFATAYDGYLFVAWSDGNTDNPRTIRGSDIASDTTLTAYFAEDPEYVPAVPSEAPPAYPCLRINEKYNSDGELVNGTFTCNGSELLEFTTEPYIPVTYFNGTYNVDEIPYNPADTSFTMGAQLPANIDDRFYPASINIPFPFWFFGIEKTWFHIGDNGVIAFNKNTITESNNYCPYSYTAPIPWTDGTSGAPTQLYNMRDAIYGVYEDLWTMSGNALSGNQGIYFGVLGESPNRMVVVSWNQIPVYIDTTNRQTYQIVFYEGTNIVEVHVKRRGCCAVINGGPGIIGIQNASGQPQMRNNNPGTSNGLVQDGSPAAFYPLGYNITYSSFVNKSFRFTPQGYTQYVCKWYRIFDDGRDSVVLSTNQDDTNGYYVPMDDSNTEHPNLTKMYAHPTGLARYVCELGFQNANNDWYFLRDTVTVEGCEPMPGYDVTVVSNNDAMGTTSGSGSYQPGATATLWAYPNDGYHFTAWSDGNTSNPRTLILAQDTSLTAFFAKNAYTVSVMLEDSVMGLVEGGGMMDYLDSAILLATAYYGYHFTAWSDGDTTNPRIIILTQDTALTALFAINQYQLDLSANDPELGSVTGGGSYFHGDMATATAIPTAGNRFYRWSDNVYFASRSIQMTSNMQLVAIFVPVDTVYVHDTTYIDVHDTTYVDIHDTAVVHDTTYVEVYVPVHDTTYIDMPYAVHDTTYIDVHDTTYIDVPYAVHDTTYIDVHDTTYIDVPYAVHDTTVFVDTVTLTEYVPVHDTTYIDVPYAVHDTSYVDIYDTVYIVVTEYDTITNTVYDTTVVDNYIYDTTFLHDTTMVTDTLWLPGDTVYITVHDTVYLHDTVFVGMEEVETITAKLYQRDGQIVVEGAEGMAVVVYDAVGRRIATAGRDARVPGAAGGETRIPVPSTGVYLVKVGDAPARRVVVVR